MKSKTFSGHMASIAIVVAIAFSSSTVSAQTRPSPTQAQASHASPMSAVTVVVEHAHRADVDALTARYEKHLSAKIVPIVVTPEQAMQMGLMDETSPAAMSDTEVDRYAGRELAAMNLAAFEGGDVVVAISLGTLLLILLVVVLVVILLD